jgi:subtilisin family serine protease
MSFAPVFLTVLLLPFVTPGFAGISLVPASSVQNVGSASLGGQSPPLTIAVIGNESFLQLGEGLSIKLDPSLGKTVDNRTVYDYNHLRTLPVPLIVEFKNLHGRDNALARITALGGIVNITYTQLPMVATTVPAENVSSLSGGELSLTPFSDAKVRGFLNESVPLIKPPAEWLSLEQKADRSINGTGINIAIVDTGINASHPDFYYENGTSKITFSTSFVPSEDTQDYFGHGTHVAGIAAGTGKASGYEFVGVAPGASLYNIKVLDKYGMGYMSWVIAGIESAVNHTATIINLSLGADVNTDGTDPVSLACDWAVDQGVVVVVAAGNSGPGESTVGSPGCADKVITVGASTKQDEVAGFSSRGPTYDFRIKPDVVAPGVDIVAPASVGSWIWTYLSKYEPNRIVGNCYYELDGTSMATPHVVGVAALLKELHPGWSPAMIKAAIMNSAQDLNVTSYDQGSGRVNAYLAATIPVLAIGSSMSFGLVRAGKYVLNTTVYNVEDSPQTVGAASIDTYQISNHARWPFVSTDIAPPVAVPVGGNVEVKMTLNLTQDAPEDYYDGALTLDMNKTVVRVPHNFVYESMILARAVTGNTSLDAWFFAYDFPNGTHFISFSEGTLARFFVPSGTYVVHAMGTPLSLRDSYDMFLLTEVVNVEKGSVAEVNLSLDAARTISVGHTAIDGRSLSLSESDRQLWVYVNGNAAGVLISGSGRVDLLHISDTQEDVYFNTVAYVSGQEYPDIPWRYTSIATGSRTSDAFYSLSWLLHGVNSTTSTSFTFGQGDLVKYTFKYKADGPPENNLGVGYWVFSPNPSAFPGWTTQATVHDIFPGVLRNFYVKYVDWNWNDSAKREYLVAFCLTAVNHEYHPLFTAVLNPRDDANKTAVFMEPPYQTDLTVRSVSGQTSCNYTITMAAEPFTKLWAGTTTVSVRRDGTEVKWNASETFAAPATISFPSIENGTYTMNVTRTTGLTLWNRVEVLAQFTKPSADENPPSITHVEVSPTFNSNDSSLHVSFNATDDVGVQYAVLWYSFDYSDDWTSANLTRFADYFEASVPLSGSVQNVSLRIKVYDDSNNYVQHTITPASTRGKPLTLSTALTVSVRVGSWNLVQLDSSDPSLRPFAVEVYENGAFAGNFLVIEGILQWIVYSQGNFLVIEKEPSESFYSQVHLSFVQDVSPVYYPSSAQTTVEVVCPVTLDQVGVGCDFNGTVLNVDGAGYSVGNLPKTFFWSVGSNHTFAYQSPLVTATGAKQYDWNSTNGLSTLQSSSITVTGSGSVTGNYVTHVHDVAVTRVAADRTWVYQGWTTSINVTINNNGDYSENVTATLYYNVTANKIICAQTVDLRTGESKTLLFIWSTMGVPYCYTNYTLTAVATIPVDNTPADNTLSGWNTTVRMLGDMNGDGKIDLRDIGTAASAFGSHPGNPRWNPNADMNGDGKIDLRDVAFVAKHFGEHAP